MPAARKPASTKTRVTSKPKHKKPTARPKKTSSHSSKSTRSNTMDSTRTPIENQASYNKLIKRGMSEAQARAFSHYAGGGVGGKSKGGKSSKPTTRRVERKKSR
jgi:hypothetical protein